GVFLLAQERGAEKGLGVERTPGFGLLLLADDEALAQYGFCFGPLLLLEQAEAERRQFASVGERVGSGSLLDHCQPLPPPRLRLVELLQLFVAGDQVADDPARILVLEALLFDARGRLLVDR